MVASLTVFRFALSASYVPYLLLGLSFSNPVLAALGFLAFVIRVGSSWLGSVKVGGAALPVELGLLMIARPPIIVSTLLLSLSLAGILTVGSLGPLIRAQKHLRKDDNSSVKSHLDDALWWVLTLHLFVFSISSSSMLSVALLSEILTFLSWPSSISVVALLVFIGLTYVLFKMGMFDLSSQKAE